LGGAVTHTEISGIADYKFDTEQECLTQIKKIMSKLGDQPKAGFNKIKALVPAKNLKKFTASCPKAMQNLTILETL
jgi:acetyl-CoA carboxylase carboxyltransferase component